MSRFTDPIARSYAFYMEVGNLLSIVLGLINYQQKEMFF
ncbi:hypothetical protein IX332_001910 [Porphyromonas levii]|nr:hypothetical protein [Porphyromonas levii]MBR8770659.1 hypothetical protein [Porphyromonas levii]